MRKIILPIGSRKRVEAQTGVQTSRRDRGMQRVRTVGDLAERIAKDPDLEKRIKENPIKTIAGPRFARADGCVGFSDRRDYARPGGPGGHAHRCDHGHVRQGYAPICGGGRICRRRGPDRPSRAITSGASPTHLISKAMLPWKGWFPITWDRSDTHRGEAKGSACDASAQWSERPCCLINKCYRRWRE
jgi:hypothetical protein